MTQALLLMAWPNQGEVVTSFRYATGYNLPDVYSGNAKLTQISSTVNDTSFEVIYRCENCFSWNHDGATGSVATSSNLLILGYAQSKTAPTTPSCPGSSFKQHDTFGQYGAQLNDSANTEYTKWTALATKTANGACTTTATATTTSATATATTTAVPQPTVNCVAPSKQSYDYIVVGSGAGGIPIADRLSDAGHSVLLIEKGPPSSGRYDGTMKPTWLESTNLTRFDVPGLCNQIWVDSAGVACTDTDQMAGCVLGGGTAVNAGLWWKVGHPPSIYRKELC
jgi:cellobiose dehydrogenase (acceptor)